MNNFWKTVGAVIVGFLIFGAIKGLFTIITIVSFVGAMSSTEKTTQLSDNAVYKLELEGTVVDYSAAEDLSGLFSLMGSNLTPFASVAEKISVSDIRRNLRLAAEDKKVKALYLDCGSLAAAPASIEEIRTLILKFKESGKPVIAYADSYTQGCYWLASTADHIYMNPQGMVTISGINFTTMFYKGALDKLGIEMQVFKVGTFKSAVEPYILDHMSDANRLQMTRLADCIWGKMSSDIAESRGITTDDVNNFAEEGLTYTDPANAIKAGLIDSLVYRQDMKNIVKKLIGHDPKVFDHSDMCNVDMKEKSAGNKVAVLYAMGDIDGNSADGIVSEDIVKELNDLAKDEKVKAVVFRVNSPGGSAFGSEQMWYALTKLKAKKPVVVSMGDYAASGGYYISCNADTILAYHTTLTGSIGIFGVIPCFAGTANMVGLSFDGVKSNKYADLGSLYRPFTEDEKVLFQNYINRGYETFVGRCANGRGLTTDSIKSIAEGRVWMGDDALNIGLVDKIGTLEDAINIAAKKAGLKDNYVVKEFPAKKGFSETIMEMLGEKKEEKEIRAMLGGNTLPFLVDQYRKVLSMRGVQAYMPYKIIL